MWAKDALGAISDLLFLPVVVGLLGVVLWTVLALGLFLRSLIGRYRGRRPARDRYRAAIDQALTGQPHDDELAIEEIVARAEGDAARSLNAVRFAIRIGPSLGLMGTLIPMATALSGLARGDLQILASNMVIAFSSTVVGLAVGVVAYLVAMVREGWARADLDAVRFHAERVLRREEA
ncbi:MotA/TolQ/ExbB proton channel family protein [Sphingobium lignivorans]|uniref:Biopolymer transport protein ExbB/TolQ n=1 Tax=Sphingobium lignivorans TaxID=2735886 RepID=A0ABR6NJ88_9SPHN|nr:MotA/TolQ/ExbB proton channel family protein [Sphingobium lignivorans]MBB5986677.1 biopolymer transport protein ExbB/TolQ [Sphingobium lignivorans]